MVWPQFPIKILRVHFVNFVLDNSNKDKISHSLTKKFWEKKKWKKRVVNQILLSKLRYIGPTYTISTFIKKEIKETIAQLSIWKCGVGILDIDTQLNCLKLKWIQILYNLFKD